MTGTDIEIIPPTSDIAARVAEVFSAVRTNATTDQELAAAWTKSHGNGSPNTLRTYKRISARFLIALHQQGGTLRTANIEDIQSALDVFKVKEAVEQANETKEASTASAATINTSIATVKSLLRFAHGVGYMPFNAGPLIRTKKAPSKLAQRILTTYQTECLIDAARNERDRVLLDVAYASALRVSELAALRWFQVIPREGGKVQLAVTGKGDKERNVLLPPETASSLLALQGDAEEDDRVFGASDRRIRQIIKQTVQSYIRANPTARATIPAAISPHWLRHAHASHSLDEGAPISLVSQTLGHASIKTTSVYSHARPNDSSGLYLKRSK